MLLMILLLFNKGMTHECVHDRIAKEIKHVPNHPYKEPTHSPIDGRLMQSDKRPLNIHFDFTYLDRNPDADFVTYIKHSILPQAQDTIKEFLYVNDTITIQPFDRTGCDQFFAIPEYYTKTPVDADIIIFVTYEDVEESYLAYAAPCLKRSSNNRPIVGFISINKKHVVMAKDQVDPMVYLLIHEIFHILAMSPALYDSFQARQPVYAKETGTFNGQQTKRWKFITPKLVEVAKEYYDCESITGVYLENNGATGNVASHFEKLHTGNELMVAQDVGFDTISVFSLALFEDTGWYIVDHSKAEYLSWGKGKGCSFYNNSTCQETIGEYCDSHNTRNCSPDYLTKTYCLDTPYSDGCLINEYFDDFICATPHQLQKTSLYEEVSNESRCFIDQARRPSKRRNSKKHALSSKFSRLRATTGCTLANPTPELSGFTRSAFSSVRTTTFLLSLPA